MESRVPRVRPAAVIGGPRQVRAACALRRRALVAELLTNRMTITPSPRLITAVATRLPSSARPQPSRVEIGSLV